MKRKKVKYHPCKRLWRLMVYSLVTTSSFLPFPDFSGIFAAHLFTERSRPSSFFRLLQLNPSCCFTINILPLYNKVSSSCRKTTYIPFRRGFFVIWISIFTKNIKIYIKKALDFVSWVGSSLDPRGIDIWASLLETK